MVLRLLWVEDFSLREFIFQMFDDYSDLSRMPAFLRLKPEFAKIILEKAKIEFGRGYLKGISDRIWQDYNVSISRDTIRRILRIKGHKGAFENVDLICKYADLDWKKVADFAPVSPPPIVEDGDDIDEIVHRICQNMEFLFEKESPNKLGASLTWLKSSFIELDLAKVEVLPSKYPALYEELIHKASEREDEYDLLGIKLLHGDGTTTTKILEEPKNILIYGDPGSGKSSYLKWIALQCRDRVLLKEYIPLFLEMRHFSVFGSGQTLMTFFEEMFGKWGLTPVELEKVLASGRGLFIFDGVDETNKSERYRILTMIRRLLVKYDQCRFILSSRLAFDLQLPQLQKVIISPLNSKKHIPIFVRQWFDRPSKDAKKAEIILEKFKSPRYRGIREIARRPVLLEFLCYLFDKLNEFPTKRADVFRTGMKQLVLQVDDSVYTGIKELPELKPKDIRNILCRIAKYFFVDLGEFILFHTRDVERIIEDYYVDVYNVNREMVDGEHLLSMIEQFNGLIVRWAQDFCAFSHVTFQEYFVAQHLVDRDEQIIVYEYLIHPRWPFVIELVAELLPKEKIHDFFYGFKIAVDALVNRDEELKRFLENLSRTASLAAVQSGDKAHPFKTVLTRAWYLVYAVGEYTDKIDGALPNLKNFGLPDMTYVTSMVSNRTLDIHAALYDLYHCIDQEDPLCLQSNMKKLIKLLQSVSPQGTSILKSWLEQIDHQQSKYAKDDAAWWQEERIRNKWKVSISRFMDRLGVPSIFSLTDTQVSLLKKYYTATYLFSNSMIRSKLDKDQHQEFANSMLLLTHFPPDERPEFDDFPTF